MYESYPGPDIPIITDAEIVVEGEPMNSNSNSNPSNYDVIATAGRQQDGPPPAKPGMVGVTSSVSKPSSSGNGTKVVRPANSLSYTAVSTNNKNDINNSADVLERPKTMFRNLGRNATGLLCPHCHRQTVTAVDDVLGVGTVVAVVILAILFWPICWLPLCVPSCKRTNHYCGHPTCGKKVGETHVCA
jgi:lipopolysaccharide-induced tumor necrosis factor-alpha factor